MCVTKMKIRSRIFLIICVLVCILAVHGTGSASETSENVQLEPIVVTATRTEKGLASTPGSVSVVTKEDMEQRNIKSVDEALNIISGVYHNNAGKGLLGTTASVSLRGLSTDKRTLFMVDGMTLNDAYTGSVGYQLLPVEDVDQIEVVKGPFSSLYGGYAMGGVVNVITRMPEKREFTLKTGYGSSWNRAEALDDLQKIYFSYGDRFMDKFSLLASYGYKSTNGYPTSLNVQSSRPPEGITGWKQTTDNQGRTRYLIGDTGDNTWWDDQLTLKGRIDLTPETKLDLSFLRGRYEYDYDSPHTCLRDTDGNEVWSYGSVREYSFLSGYGRDTQNIYNMGFETKISYVDVKLKLGYLDKDTNWYVTRGTTAATTRSGGPGTINDTPSSSYNTDLQFSIPAWNRHIFTFGTTYRTAEAHTKAYDLANWKNENSKTNLNYESKGKDRTYALFFQDEITILENLTAYIGFRQDWWKTYDGYANDIGKPDYPQKYGDRSDNSFSPKAALVYKPLAETTLRASAGRAFRPPTVYDLYRTWTGSTGIVYAANPDLEPETVTSWDAGVEQGLWPGMTVKATYFENYLKDMIYRKTVTQDYREFINAAKAETKGVELEAEQKFPMGLGLFANYTYTDAKMKKNKANPESEGKRLTQVPEHMFNAGILYNQGPFSSSLIGRYLSKRYTNDLNTDKKSDVFTSYDSHFVADFKTSCKITEFAEVSLSVENIFDEEYFGYYVAPGRSWFGELVLRF